MSFNTFGKLFRFTTWGESHGPAIGCIIDGCPPLIQIKEQDIQKELDRRKPGQHFRKFLFVFVNFSNESTWMLRDFFLNHDFLGCLNWYKKQILFGLTPLKEPFLL